MVRLGVIGLGNMGSVHARTIPDIRGATLVAVADAEAVAPAEALAVAVFDATAVILAKAVEVRDPLELGVILRVPLIVRVSVPLVDPLFEADTDFVGVVEPVDDLVIVLVAVTVRL